MPRGIYTQTVCILLRDEVSLAQLRPLLEQYTIRREVQASDNWGFGGPTYVVDYRPEVNGYVAVDVVNHPWPDGMGDPQQESLIFGAWSMSCFGPVTFPGGLQRAMQQSWVWPEGKDAPNQHQGFLRIRSSYAFGADGKSPVWPEDYDAEQDLEFVTKVAQSLLVLPQALCYFNPGGEVLRNRELTEECLEYAESQSLPALDLWSNVRLFNIDENFSLMDTVGNEQLDLPDIEAVISRDYDCGEIDSFLRNATYYLLSKGADVIKDKDTMDGPRNVRWQAHHFPNGLTDPPRRVICFVPLDGKEVPAAVLNRQE